jgi:hypothetical protein
MCKDSRISIGTAWPRLLLVSTVVCGMAGGARADDAVPDLSSGPLPVRSLREIANQRPSAPAAPAGYHPGGSGGGGLVLGVDLGGAFSLDQVTSGTTDSGALGFRLGYEFPFGLAVSGRYDYLGVSEGTQLLTAGLRYSAVFIWPVPFAELMGGAAFLKSTPAGVGSETEFTGGLGLGVSFPLQPELAIDLSLRDWLIASGSTNQILTAELGLRISLY